VSDPNTGQAIRTGDIIPEPAIDPATGQLYVVWQDSRFNGGHFDEVALSTSTNGGATWSAPIRVNTPKGRPAFTPMVRVNSTHVVAVTYYDFRNLTTQTATLPTDYWVTESTNNGTSFDSEAHIAGPFDMLTHRTRVAFSLATTRASGHTARRWYRSSSRRTPATPRTGETCLAPM